MNKADGLLDVQPKLFIPSTAIIGYTQETTKVSCHISPDWSEDKNQPQTRRELRSKTTCLNKAQ